MSGGADPRADPWSARVPMDPLLADEISLAHAKQADGGVGCGPGGPPHQLGVEWGFSASPVPAELGGFGVANHLYLHIGSRAVLG
jgi:hypothetical protein